MPFKTQFPLSMMKYTFWVFVFVHGSMLLSAEPTIDFRRQIQPILSEHCNLCHGADESARQSGLRLDVEALAYQGGESGLPAILPGDSAKSQMIQRILSADPDSVMPPPAANHRGWASHRRSTRPARAAWRRHR